MRVHPYFIQELKEQEHKNWFARAIVGLIVVDGVLNDEELEYLEHMIMYLEDPVLAEYLVQEIKDKNPPTLPILRLERDIAISMLLEFMELVIIDEKIAKPEAGYFIEIAQKLGFDFSFARKILTWAIDLIKIEKDRKIIIDHAKKTTPFYK